MNATDIIATLRAKLDVAGGRHLYGVLGTYPSLETFALKLGEARTLDDQPFPEPLSVNRGILDTIPDRAFKELVETEARRPEPTSAHVGSAFEKFLRGALRANHLLVLAELEMLFAYQVELHLLRTLATDDQRVILLLPGRRERGEIVLFPDADEGQYTLPTNLIAENHLWELSSNNA